MAHNLHGCPVEILVVAMKALIGLMEIDYPMIGDAKAAGLVTGGPTLDMDPRDKHEDDNRECVCRCALATSTASSTDLLPSAQADSRGRGDPC